MLNLDLIIIYKKKTSKKHYVRDFWSVVKRACHIFNVVAVIVLKLYTTLTHQNTDTDSYSLQKWLQNCC